MLPDLRHGIRALARAPAFTVVAVSVLALGVGASTALFSVLNAVLLRPLPYRNPERLVMVWDSVPRLGLDRNLVSPLNFVDWQRHNPVFSSMGAYTENFLNLVADDGGAPERVYGLTVTPLFFDTLGVRPAVGRLFGPEDTSEAGARPLVLSHDLWQRRFGGDPDIVGRSIPLGRIVGVMPSGFFFPSPRFEVYRLIDTDRWTSIGAATEAQLRSWRHGRWLTVVARLRADVAVAEAQAAMDVVTARLATQYPEANEGRGAYVRPISEELLGAVRPALLFLQGAVVLVLFIAAVNVANLQLIRSLERGRELATRAALGATRRRLVRLLFAENLLLAVLGGGAGALLAFYGTRLILAISPGSVPRIGETSMDGRVLLFSLLCTLSGCLISGVFPALRASRANLRDALQQGNRGGGLGRSRAQDAFAVAQIALSLALLAGAGLLTKSFVCLQGVAPGFIANESVAVDLSQSGVDREALAPFWADLLERVEALPGVRAAGITSHLPLSGEEGRRSFAVAGDQTILANETTDASFRRVSAGYFDSMGIPLQRGRGFIAGESGVVIVNEVFVRRFLPGGDPLGRSLVIEDGPARPREIVGVVGDVRHTALTDEAQPEMYVTHADRPWPNMTLVVRATNGDPSALVPSVGSVVAAVDPTLPLANVKTIDQYVAGSVGLHRFRTRLAAAFAVAAVLLAALGLYNVVAYGVARRRHEIGLRMALGADSDDVLRLIVGDGLRLVGVGLALGLGGALAVGRAMSGLLYEVSPLDPFVLGGVIALLASIALAACYVPAYRACRLDPLIVMRAGER
jgi:putative ABC transport system permease protein